jgi:transposase-like protein
MTSYEAFFDLLKERGVEKVDLIISDGHKGIKRAVAHSFVGSSWQLCTVHFKRNLLKVVPQKDIKSILEDINVMLHSKTLEDAIEYANGMA